MRQRWNKDQYGSFRIGRPTSTSIEKCILLPATHRHLVIVYPRAADGLFSKENKVSVATADTPEGARLATAEHSPTRSPLAKLWQTGSALARKRKEAGLQKCCRPMRRT